MISFMEIYIKSKEGSSIVLYTLNIYNFLVNYISIQLNFKTNFKLKLETLSKHVFLGHL